MSSIHMFVVSAFCPAEDAVRACRWTAWLSLTIILSRFQPNQDLAGGPFRVNCDRTACLNPMMKAAVRVHQQSQP